MFERELTLYQFNLNFIRTIAADLTDADLGRIPFPGANPPVWILGHLAIATDSAGRIFGLPPICPPEWRDQFGPGSNPAEIKQPWPTKEALLAAIEAGHQRVSEAAPGASPEVIDSPHRVEILKRTNLKTLGDVAAHLMTNHASFHIAQLSACRRHAGKGPII